MKQRTLTQWFAIITTLITISSMAATILGSGQSSGANRTFLPIVQNNLPPIIPDTTKLLSENTIQNLTSISSDGSIFTFSQTTDELETIRLGDIIVGGVTPNISDGFLRKVTNISTSDTSIIITTETGTLTDAIQQGELHIKQALSSENVISSTTLEGVHLMSTPNGEFYIPIDDTVLLDADGNSNTTGDQVRANGLITLEPTYDFDLVVEDWELQELELTVEMNEEAELEITAYIEAYEAEAEKSIASYVFAPITIFIGWLPVVLQPQLDVVVGLDGSVHIGVSTAVIQTATLTAGAVYENGDWNTINELSNSFTFEPPTLSAGLTLRAYTGARITLKLYGVVGPYIEVNPYLELEADIFSTPWWELYGGIEVPVGIHVQVFDHQLADFEAVAIGYRLLIAQAEDGGTSTPTSTPPSGTTIIVPVPTIHPSYGNGMCESGWLQISGYSGQPAYLTLNTDGTWPSTNWGEWHPDLPVSGFYRIEAWIPNHPIIDWDCPDLTIYWDTSEAPYTIHHDNGTSNIFGDQQYPADEWIDLGVFEFSAGSSGWVELHDLNDEPALSRTISFSALRFTLQTAQAAFLTLPSSIAPMPISTPAVPLVGSIDGD